MTPAEKLIAMGIPKEHADQVCFCQGCMAMREGLEKMAGLAASVGMTAVEMANNFAIVAGTTVGQLAAPGMLDITIFNANRINGAFARAGEARDAMRKSLGVKKS